MSQATVATRARDFFTLPQHNSLEAERLHRKQRLAAAFRIFARRGFDQGLAGHITARDPELTDHFWVNPLGKHFGQIRVSDLQLVNEHGEIVEGDQPINEAAFVIHAAIHKARPGVVAAAHTHSTYGKAWSTLGRLLDPITQDSCTFYGDHGLYGEFHGVVLESEEGQRIVGALGDRKAVILQNHGFLTAGPSVEAAAWWYIAMDNAAHAQLLAEAAGKPIVLDHDTAKFTYERIGGPTGGALSFKPLWDWIVAAEPDLLD